MGQELGLEAASWNWKCYQQPVRAALGEIVHPLHIFFSGSTLSSLVTYFFYHWVWKTALLRQHIIRCTYLMWWSCNSTWSFQIPHCNSSLPPSPPPDNHPSDYCWYRFICIFQKFMCMESYSTCSCLASFIECNYFAIHQYVLSISSASHLVVFCSRLTMVKVRRRLLKVLLGLQWLSTSNDTLAFGQMALAQ